MKIPNSDKCPNCNYWSGDDERGFKIISEDRYNWLKMAAEAYHKSQGDDDWLDWEQEHKALLTKGE